jgi:hypothetical protein
MAWDGTRVGCGLYTPWRATPCDLTWRGHPGPMRAHTHAHTTHTSARARIHAPHAHAHTSTHARARTHEHRRARMRAPAAAAAFAAGALLVRRRRRGTNAHPCRLSRPWQAQARESTRPRDRPGPRANGLCTQSRRDRPIHVGVYTECTRRERTFGWKGWPKRSSVAARCLRHYCPVGRDCCPV